MIYLKLWEKQEQVNSKTSRWEEILKFKKENGDQKNNTTNQWNKVSGLKKMNKIPKPLAKLTKRKEKTQINKIRDEKGIL
jgi:hypothetical protein